MGGRRTDNATDKARKGCRAIRMGPGVPPKQKRLSASDLFENGVGPRTDPVPRSKGEDPATARAVDDDGYEATWIFWHELAAAEAKKGLALSPILPACRPRGLASMMDAMPELIIIIRSSS